MESICIDQVVINLEERRCRVCGCIYKYDREDGSDLECCSEACEADWIAFEEDMKVLV